MSVIDQADDTGSLPPLDVDVPDSLEGWTRGVVRRVRRAADLSQRDLAHRLGVAQSTVARWETGRLSPSAAQLEQMLTLAHLRVVLVDEVGRPVAPMREDRARDRAGRRYPAHLDPWATDWWTPRDAERTPFFPELWRNAREREEPRVRYQRRGFWRDVMRGDGGIAPDHPSLDLLRASVHRRTRPIRQTPRTGGPGRPPSRDGPDDDHG